MKNKKEPYRIYRILASNAYKETDFIPATKCQRRSKHKATALSAVFAQMGTQGDKILTLLSVHIVEPL